MYPTVINPIPLLISLTAVFGVFMHDTRIDNAMVAAVSMPAIVAQYASSPDKLLTVDQHIHAENGPSFTRALSFNSLQPAKQPKNEDDKKYITQKRLMGNTFGNEYSWPSI